MTVKNWLRGHHVYNIIKRNKLHSKGDDKIKRQPSEWEKITARETTGLISKIHKQLMQFNTRKANNPIKKWGAGLHRHFSKEGIQTVNKHGKRW